MQQDDQHRPRNPVPPGVEPEADEPDDAAAAAQKRQGRSLLAELPILFVVALLIALVVKTFVLQAFFIPTGSMQDTLQIRDKILVNKLVYHFRSIEPGDIVVFNGAGTWNPQPAPVPASSNPFGRLYDDTLRRLFNSVGGLFGTPLGQVDYVKRVIGVPGDHVVCCNAQGLVTVNGVPVHEQSYLYPGNKPNSSPAGIPARFNVTVPPGYRSSGRPASGGFCRSPRPSTSRGSTSPGRRRRRPGPRRGRPQRAWWGQGSAPARPTCR
jgi:signal peptidase I